MLRPKVLWPFPDKEVKAMGEKVHTIIVPEMNLGQMAHEVEWAVAGAAGVERINLVSGEPIPPTTILQKIEEVASR